MAITVESADNTDWPIFTPDENSLLAKAIDLNNFESAQEAIAFLLSNNLYTPLDDEATEYVRFIAGHTVSDNSSGCVASDVMVITKMPTREESNRQMLHCGEPGRLWMEHLQSKGLDVSNWFLQTVCQFRVPDHLAGKGALKVKYVKEGQPLLSESLNLVRPQYVLLFGADALKSFIRLFNPKMASKVKFNSARGQLIEFPGNIQAMVCTSPHLVARKPELLAEFHSDLDRFAELVSAGQLTNQRQPDAFDIRNFAGLQELVESLIQADYKRFALDLEWGTRLRTIQLSWADNTGACLLLHDENDVNTELGDNLELVIDFLTVLLKRDGIGICGHNVRGDIKLLREYGLDLMPEFLSNGFDTMLAYHHIPGNETLDKVLELVALKELNIPRYDADLRKWLVANGLSKEKLNEIGYGTIPNDILIPYATMDVIITFELWKVLEDQLKAANTYDLYATVVHPVNDPVLEMEETGMHVDKNRLMQLSDMFQEKKAALKLQLQKMANWKPHKVVVKKKKKDVEVDVPGFNPDSPDQVKELLFGVFKEDASGNEKRASPVDAVIQYLTPVKATDDTLWEIVQKQGKAHLYAPSTDSESLGILGATNEFAKLMQTFRFCSQICKTFTSEYEVTPDGPIWHKGLGAKISKDGKLRTNVRTTLETGRYATKPNLQNLYTEVVKLFELLEPLMLCPLQRSRKLQA